MSDTSIQKAPIKQIILCATKSKISVEIRTSGTLHPRYRNKSTFSDYKIIPRSSRYASVKFARDETIQLIANNFGISRCPFRRTENR